MTGAVFYYDIPDDPAERLTDLERAVDALREICDLHIQVVDGPRLICERCAHLWPCEHAEVLRDIEDLL